MKAPAWKELVGGRIVAQKDVQDHGPVECTVVELSPSGALVKLHIPHANVVVWQKVAEWEVLEILPPVSALEEIVETQKQLTTIRMTHDLTISYAGSDTMVHIMGRGDGYNAKPFRGETLLEALTRAAQHVTSLDSKTKRKDKQ